MSRLRARCPDCRTLTAVALGPEYQCHSCGREFLAGLVRVPRAWGDGGETMAEAAHLELPYPEASVIEADSLAEQNLLLASRAARPADRPRRLLLLARRRDRGALRGRGVPRGRLARRPRRPEHAADLAVGQRVGNAVADGDRRRRRASPQRRPRRRPEPRPARGGVHRVGRRARRARVRSSGRSRARTPSTSRSTATRSIPASWPSSCPSRTACGSTRSRRCSQDLSSRIRVAGLGFTGLVRDDANEPKLVRLAAALGL